MSRIDLENLTQVIAAEGHLTYKKAREVALILRSTARRLHVIYERQCNGYHAAPDGWDAIAEKRDEKREDSIISRVTACIADTSLKVVAQGDPRGPALYVLTPKTGRYNGMGGREKGWGVE